MDVAAWLARATADAEARGLPELKPLLETLARSTQALRDADGEFRHPAADHTESAADPAEHAESPDDKTAR
jgi:hypothetical protein